MLQLAQVEFLDGNALLARAIFSEALTACRGWGYRVGIPAALWGLASTETARGQPERAAMLHGTAAAWR
ncbi:MAG TPA: tetratricopeptide repeat protein [Solirubrobacteraceae bacterium]|nr:tetratricopeptide repeat protein [Solirubrobacteraceae bacterium]